MSDQIGEDIMGISPDAPPPVPISPQVNPWIAIVYRPRAAMRSVLDRDPRQYFFLIPLLTTLVIIPSTLLNASAQIDMFNEALRELQFVVTMKWIYVYLLFAVPATYGFYLLHIYAFGWLYHFIGSRMGGHGTQEELRAACVWTLLPWFYYTALLIPFSLLFADLYNPGLYSSAAFGTGAIARFMFMGFLNLAVVVYMAFIHAQCVAAAHRFSAWNALGVILLTFVAGMALLFAVAVLVGIIMLGVVLAMG